MDGRNGKDMGRESRGEKDTATVEIMFALVTASLLAAVVFGIFYAPTLVVGTTTAEGRALLLAGTVAAGLAWVWRVVRVLTRFDARRRLGR
ncbi:DUF6332 family protein [Streptomyces sp. NPDC001941]|uniref:DUF6332 family protein n=1 Tax=Streptomyces sp. NPDC001941 TaxID=3154659 RepID=UPI00331D245E